MILTSLPPLTHPLTRPGIDQMAISGVGERGGCRKLLLLVSLPLALALALPITCCSRQLKLRVGQDVGRAHLLSACNNNGH